MRGFTLFFVCVCGRCRWIKTEKQWTENTENTAKEKEVIRSLRVVNDSSQPDILQFSLWVIHTRCKYVVIYLMNEEIKYWTLDSRFGARLFLLIIPSLPPASAEARVQHLAERWRLAANPTKGRMRARLRDAIRWDWRGLAVCLFISLSKPKKSKEALRLFRLTPNP